MPNILFEDLHKSHLRQFFWEHTNSMNFMIILSLTYGFLFKHWVEENESSKEQWTQIKGPNASDANVVEYIYRRKESFILVYAESHGTPWTNRNLVLSPSAGVTKLETASFKETGPSFCCQLGSGDGSSAYTLLWNGLLSKGFLYYQLRIWNMQTIRIVV